MHAQNFQNEILKILRMLDILLIFLFFFYLFSFLSLLLASSSFRFCLFFFSCFLFVLLKNAELREFLTDVNDLRREVERQIN